MTSAPYRRLVRRETHSSRSGIAVTLAVILIIVLAWIGTESVLAAIGRPALLVAPADGAASVLRAAEAPVGLLTAGAVIVALVGLVLVGVALGPGRRGRRGSISSRTAAIVDDGVIAQSVARAGARVSDIPSDQVRVTVAKRKVLVDVTPTSGRPVDSRSIQEAVDSELASYDYRPALRGRVRVSTRGTVS